MWSTIFSDQYGIKPRTRTGRWTFHRMSSLVAACSTFRSCHGKNAADKDYYVSQWPWGWHSTLQFLSLARRNIWWRLPYFTEALNFYTNQSHRAWDKDRVWAMALNCVYFVRETWEVEDENLDTFSHRWCMEIWEYGSGWNTLHKCEAWWVQVQDWVAVASTHVQNHKSQHRSNHFELP